jgi:hypothetical protein
MEYTKLYDEFIISMDKGLADATKASECLVRLSRMYSDCNTAANEARKKYVLKLSEITQTVDPASNKPMTSAKAEVLADASPENAKFLDLRTDLENIGTFISAVKYFSQSLVREYGNSQNV